MTDQITNHLGVDDHETDWALRNMSLVLRLTRLTDAIKAGEQK